MDHQVAVEGLAAAHELYARAGGIGPSGAERPPIFKVIGIVLAASSGLFIGSSFVLKKYGLLKANEKYSEVAGEGYGYLKNFWWWSGMILMIFGEILNFVALSFTDAILVTPLGALSVVICAILSAIFLKERLSMVGKVACFLCIVGSIVIVLNAPAHSSVANIEQMQAYVITPGFLSYTGVILVGCIITALYAGPRWGKKNMLVYISICSWIGGLSVVATQGLGAAIITQIGGTPQFNQWFLYVLLVFVIATLLTEIIYLNKALNLFNAAMVTPTYYVYFTSSTIIASSVLFQGFKGTATSIITVVNGFLTICAGVVLLQLSRSAKDVPDAAVFKGDLDQIHTIAEQEQSETDPKADAIRGTAAIIRRLSSARLKMEADELKRMHEEKQQEALAPLNEDGAQFEWDGIRRRRTTYGSARSRAMTPPSLNPFGSPAPAQHPPLGWSHFPTQEELDALDRPSSPGALSSIVGTIRTRARSVFVPPQSAPGTAHDDDDPNKNVQDPLHPVPLTDINVHGRGNGQDLESGVYNNGKSPSKARYQDSTLSVPGTTHGAPPGRPRGVSEVSDVSSLGPPPTPPAHGTRRQFSFQRFGLGLGLRHGNNSPQQQHQQQQPQQSHAHGNAAGVGGGDGAADSPHPSSSRRPGSLVARARGYSNPQAQEASEEERLGLVTGDSRSLPSLPRYGDVVYEDEELESFPSEESKEAKYGRGITSSPSKQLADEDDETVAEYEARRKRWNETRGGGGESSSSGGASPVRPPRGNAR
ncbi:non-imprinted in Prader-Willi/Angelman syndrome region protein 2 [Magnaporthiopsis poae ATCC 64411]|uniref:Non-imprinted in Prader-Willi/Angelman syndrome region protein 2 n=1 Tax=Magnaporthiopsis poae (strain ATCC 64411 / 73-15) TaxID=644358 RepID=A0A0C4DNH1_MAGP6|nr:non-imprinted in Prader-Willi/Angelman syndrome region protein 2 [Magnaporthiopsis poae ATCC 64411]